MRRCFASGLLVAVSLVFGWAIGKYVVGTPVVICGNSMEPALGDGHCFWAHNLFPWQRIKRGDIVVFRDGSGDSVKRVVGLPGDTIRMHLGFVFLNGVQMDESYVLMEMPTPAASAGEVLRAGADEYIVMGDNRTESFDSRDYGPIERSRIHGRLTTSR